MLCSRSSSAPRRISSSPPPGAPLSAPAPARKTAYARHIGKTRFARSRRRASAPRDYPLVRRRVRRSARPSGARPRLVHAALFELMRGELSRSGLSALELARLSREHDLVRAETTISPFASDRTPGSRRRFTSRLHYGRWATSNTRSPSRAMPKSGPRGSRMSARAHTRKIGRLPRQAQLREDRASAAFRRGQRAVPLRTRDTRCGRTSPARHCQDK